MNRNLMFAGAGLLALSALVLGVVLDFLTPPETDRAATDGLTAVTFATDWKAQAEHGGFYQAKALGLYEAAGLDVTIRPGGPGSNIPQLLGAGAVDFGMGSNQFIVMNMALEGVPAKAVMAVFQKDPQVILTHPRDDVKSLADLKGKPVMISDATIGSFWIWLKAKYGFTDAQIRKYNYSLAPFLSDPKAIQQGYVTSEPYTIEQASGVAPHVFLLADNGYPGYATFVLARTELIGERPQIVQAFVDASIEGWRSYLEDDPAPGNALIKSDNPEMTDALIAQAIEKMKSYHLVVPEGAGADPATAIGHMTHARWRGFYELMQGEHLYPEGFDLSKAYTLEFLE